MRLNPRRGCQHSSSINVDAAAATELVGDLVITVAEFNLGGELRRPDPMMCWGGSFLADSSCTALSCFTTALLVQKVEGKKFPPQLPLYYWTLDWRRLFGCDLHIADCAREKREQSCCFVLSLVGGVVQ